MNNSKNLKYRTVLGGIFCIVSVKASFPGDVKTCDVFIPNPVVAENIRNWMSVMSVKRPVKCNNNFPEEKSSNSIWNIKAKQPVAKSYPCQLSDQKTPFEIRGSKLKIVEGKLEGSGKVIFTKKWESSELKSSNTCWALSFQNKNPMEIVGEFKTGLLDGLCKIQFVDNTTRIGNFHLGVGHGFSREWNTKGELTYLGNEYFGNPIGPCWRRENIFFVYEDCSSFERQTKPLSLVMTINKTAKEIYSGQLSSTALVLAELGIPRVNRHGPLDSCIVEVNFTNSKPSKDRMFLFDGKVASEKFQPDESVCSKIMARKSSAQEKLAAWLNETLNNFNVNSAAALYSLKHPEEPVDENKAILLLNEVKLEPDMSDIVEVKIFNNRTVKFKLVVKQLDKNLRCHGFCELSMMGIHQLTNSWLIGNAMNGVLHGPLVKNGVNQILPGRKTPIKSLLYDGPGFIGEYFNGIANGSFWIGMKGQGFLHGVVGPYGKVTGDAIMYIYPDKETALFGKFENRIMRHTQECEIFGVGCNSDGLMVITQKSNPTGPFFYYQPPTNESFGAGPKGVLDPFERKWLELRPSSIPGSGDGVFLKRDISGSSTAGFYSGFIFDGPEGPRPYSAFCVDNTTRSDDERRACLKYSLMLSSYDAMIQIPPEFDGPETFHPTMGQKINHHFRQYNSDFFEMEHPRWGTILGIHTRYSLKAGQELFAYYGYTENKFPADFPWYFEALTALEKQERVENLHNQTSKKSKKRSQRPKSNEHG